VNGTTATVRVRIIHLDYVHHIHLELQILQFGPNYTPAKFYICISNSCNTIMLTFANFFETKDIQTPAKIPATTYVVGVHTLRLLQNLFMVC